MENTETNNKRHTHKHTHTHTHTHTHYKVTTDKALEQKLMHWHSFNSPRISNQNKFKQTWYHAFTMLIFATSPSSCAYSDVSIQVYFLLCLLSHCRCIRMFYTAVCSGYVPLSTALLFNCLLILDCSSLIPPFLLNTFNSFGANGPVGDR